MIELIVEEKYSFGFTYAYVSPSFGVCSITNISKENEKIELLRPLDRCIETTTCRFSELAIEEGKKRLPVGIIMVCSAKTDAKKQYIKSCMNTSMQLLNTLEREYKIRQTHIYTIEHETFSKNNMIYYFEFSDIWCKAKALFSLWCNLLRFGVGLSNKFEFELKDLKNIDSLINAITLMQNQDGEDLSDSHRECDRSVDLVYEYIEEIALILEHRKAIFRNRIMGGIIHPFYYMTDDPYEDCDDDESGEVSEEGIRVLITEETNCERIRQAYHKVLKKH